MAHRRNAVMASRHRSAAAHIKTVRDESDALLPLAAPRVWRIVAMTAAIAQSQRKVAPRLRTTAR